MIEARREGFLAVRPESDAHVFLVREVVPGVHHPSHGPLLDDILAAHRPDAIIAPNDRIAASLLRLCRLRGLRVFGVS